MKAQFLTVLALAALSLGRNPQAEGTEAGEVIVQNRTDQFVRLQLDGWRDTRNQVLARSGTYEFGPGERAKLQYEHSAIVAADLRYRLDTAAGSTPADGGKVWTSPFSPTKGCVEVDITEDLLAPRQESRTSVRKAWALVESQTAVILGVAHPSALFLGLEYEGACGVLQDGADRKGHFVLTYTYRWKSGVFGDVNWTRMEFFFDEGGKLYHLRPARSRPGGTSSFMPPFGFSNAVVDWLEDKIRECERIKSDPAVRRMFEAVADQNDARLLLQTWIQIQQL